MPATPVYGLRYMALTDSPDIPRDIKALADDTETTFVRVDTDIAAATTAGELVGHVIARGDRTTASAGVASATEIGVLRLDGVPVTAGRLYMVTHQWIPASTTPTDIAEVDVRYNAAGTATTGSSVLAGSVIRTLCNTNSDGRSRRAWYVPAATGTVSLLLCLKRVSGTGTVTLAAAAPARYTTMWVTDCGVDPGETGVIV